MFNAKSTSESLAPAGDQVNKSIIFLKMQMKIEQELGIIWKKQFLICYNQITRLA